jgi:hypothetical protein
MPPLLILNNPEDGMTDAFGPLQTLDCGTQDKNRITQVQVGLNERECAQQARSLFISL